MTSTARNCLRGQSRCWLSVGDTTYRLHLSEENHGKLREALEPFTANAKIEDPEPADGQHEGDLPAGR